MFSTLRPRKLFALAHISRSTAYTQVDTLKVKELTAIVGVNNVCLGESVRQQFSRDESYHVGVLPDVVIKPRTTEQVSRVARLCHKERIPIIPFGSGSGVEGGVVPITGGVTVCLMEMNTVLAVNETDFDVTIEAGASRKELNSFLRDTGLWFPIDPGADASLGGMSATSASGTNAVRYGTMRENVLNLEIVLANGDVIHTAGKGFRSRKTSAGYNLTNLFVGSEGTLGIITAITLRLHAIPEMVSVSAAVCSFPSVEDAVNVAIQTMQSNIPIARVEFLDSLAMKACNAYSKRSHPEAPTLFMEFHGRPIEVQEQLKTVTEIAVANGGTDFLCANLLEERNRLWDARHQLFYAVLALKPGSKAFITDVCVPISKLPSIISKTVADIKQNGVIGAVFGHVGDGNCHAVMLFDPNNTNLEELDVIKGISTRLVNRVWDAEGTCTGEHGIGIGKILMLEEEIGQSGLKVMKKIKQALDPCNIMNPGKVLIIR